MAVHLSKEVMDNLMRLKSQSPTIQGEKKIYRVMFDPETGSFLVHKDKHVQQIQIDVEQTSDHKIKFNACDEKNHPLREHSMAPVAWRIMQETLNVLNQIAESTSASDPEPVFEKLSELHLSPFQPIETLPGWMGELNRIEAEKRLQKKPIGSYLLRNGEDCYAENLSLGNGMSVETYLCTFREGDEKISEAMFLLTDMGWTLYRDNADLKDPEYLYHNSPQMLLHELSARAKKPI